VSVLPEISCVRCRDWTSVIDVATRSPSAARPRAAIATLVENRSPWPWCLSAGCPGRTDEREAGLCAPARSQFPAAGTPQSVSSRCDRGRRRGPTHPSLASTLYMVHACDTNTFAMLRASFGSSAGRVEQYGQPAPATRDGRRRCRRVSAGCVRTSDLRTASSSSERATLLRAPDHLAEDLALRSLSTHVRRHPLQGRGACRRFIRHRAVRYRRPVAIASRARLTTRSPLRSSYAAIASDPVRLRVHSQLPPKEDAPRPVGGRSCY